MKFLISFRRVALAVLGIGVINSLLFGVVSHAQTAVPSDFDGDGKTDFAVFRPSEGAWYILKSTGGVISQQFGQQGDFMVPQDYDGDRKTDIAVWRQGSFAGGQSVFYVLCSLDDAVLAEPWGTYKDTPVPADYDGDGKADFAVMRRGENPGDLLYWYIRHSSDGLLNTAQWGMYGDRPQPGNYDGDKRADLTVRRFTTGGVPPENPSQLNFYSLLSSDNSLFARPWGSGHEIEAQGDYDGDGKTDTALYRWSSGQIGSPGTFYVMTSGGESIAQQWGILGDFSVPGDYDGDGLTDFAIWRPSDATFYVLQSSGGLISQRWGKTGDLPSTVYLAR